VLERTVGKIGADVDELRGHVVRLLSADSGRALCQHTRVVGAIFAA
jgi:hypothetical protein